jgi:hypothetical protein
MNLYHSALIRCLETNETGRIVASLRRSWNEEPYQFLVRLDGGPLVWLEADQLEVSL